MDGFGSYAFSVWNGEGERFWVKWRFDTRQGIECMPANEVARIAGEDLNFHRRGVSEADDRGDCPKWMAKM